MKFIKDDVRWGIIGCGDVCEVKSGPAFAKIFHSKLVAVMRRNGEKAKDFAERHHVPRYYDNADELIHDKEVNAIYVATPPAFHEEFAIKSIDAGKPVYIEKPVTLNAASCRRIWDHSVKKGVAVSVAHYRRELPLFKKVQELLRKELLGNIKLIDIKLLQSPAKNTIAQTDENWRVLPEISGGGFFHDLAPHQLDILYWLFGNPKEVKGTALNQDEVYPAPDVTSLSALFGEKTFFQGLCAFNVPKNAVADACTLVGEKGTLSFPFFEAPVLTLNVGDHHNEEIIFENPQHVQQPLIEEVVRYFRGERSNPCSLEEALVTMEMMDAPHRN